MIDEFDMLKTYIPNDLNSDSKDVLKKMQQDSIEVMKEGIVEIEDQIKERQRLSQEIDDKCAKVKLSISGSVSSFSAKAIQKDESGQEVVDGAVLSAVIRLKQESVTLEKFRLEEKMTMWRDIAELKKELRERVREFKEKEHSSEMLDNILD